MSVNVGGPESPWEHVLTSSTIDFGWFVAFESINIFRVKNWLKLKYCGFIIPCYLAKASLGHFLGFTFDPLKLLCLAKDDRLMRVHYPKCAYGPYCLFNPI